MTVDDFHRLLNEFPGDWEIVIEYMPDQQFNIMVIDLVDNKSYEYSKTKKGDYTVSDALLKRMYLAVRPPK